jgi:FkbM family methyltransferase
MAYMDAQTGPSRCADEHERLLALLLDALIPGDAYLDIGANRGLLALPIAKYLGSEGHVLAFEPAADAAQELRDRADAYGVGGRISVYEVALGSADGYRTLRADPEHPDDSTKRSLFLDGPAVSTVSIHALDDLIASKIVSLPWGIQAVKIDVEGAELDVLKGMRTTLHVYRPRMIVVETIERHLNKAGATTTEVLDLLRDLGYASLVGAAAEEPLEFNAVLVPSSSSAATS